MGYVQYMIYERGWHREQEPDSKQRCEPHVDCSFAYKDPTTILHTSQKLRELRKAQAQAQARNDEVRRRRIEYHKNQALKNGLARDRTYSYSNRKLDTSLLEVRLVVVESALSTTTRVKASIREARLVGPDCPAFEAVSYCWDLNEHGRPEMKEMELGGQVCLFAASAVTALANLRHKRSERVLWIDAISINQHDSSEQMHQVGIMGEVYARSSQVLVWLGSGTLDAIRAKQSIDAILKQAAATAGNDGREFVNKVLSADGQPNHSHNHLPPNADNAALRKIYSNRWFTRLWVVQEVALARKTIICCGQTSLEMLRVLRAAAWLQYQLPDPPQGIKNAALIWKYADGELRGSSTGCVQLKTASVGRAQLERLLRPGKVQVDVSSADGHDHPACHHDVTALLHDFRHFQTTQPEDQIYAILGLCKPILQDQCVAGWMKPESDRTLSDVFQGATRTALYQSKRLDLLGTMPQFRNEPSWVPDWTTCDSQANPGMEDFASFFRAAGASEIDIASVLDEADGKLLVKGYEADAVESFTNVFPYNSSLSSVDSFFGASLQPLLYPEVPAGQEDLSMEFLNDLKKDTVMHRSLGLTLVAGTTYNRNDAAFAGKALHVTHWEGFCEVLCVLATEPPGPCSTRTKIDKEEEDGGRAQNYYKAMRSACGGRRFFLTKGKAMGIGPPDLKKGDLVTVLSGGRWPFLLRALPANADSPRYRFLGPAYVNGFMYGQKVPRNEPSDGLRLFDIR
ncbi:hypothetical protein LTR27_009217 [Elasticomyces elasticus]|nr:hypothetical protein LTR27_009217 [Elasticomyces elasticus]